MVDVKGKGIAIHATTATDSSEAVSEGSSAAMAPGTPQAEAPALATSASSVDLPQVPDPGSKWLHCNRLHISCRHPVDLHACWQ